MTLENNGEMKMGWWGVGGGGGGWGVPMKKKYTFKKQIAKYIYIYIYDKSHSWQEWSTFPYNGKVVFQQNGCILPTDTHTHTYDIIFNVFLPWSYSCHIQLVASQLHFLLLLFIFFFFLYIYKFFFKTFHPSFFPLLY